MTWLCPLTILLVPARPDTIEEAGSLAQQAFFALEAQPFHWDVRQQARALLEEGYRKGDRATLASYDAQAVAQARHYAHQALEAGPQESMAHVQWARMQILTEDYRG